MNEVLHAVADRRLAIATNKPRRFTERILEGLDALNHFDSILGPDDVAEAKPSPEMITRTLENTRSRPEKTLVVGDTQFDMIAGQRAGTAVCGVKYGYGDADLLMTLSPDYMIESPIELLDIIDLTGN
jgi:HAD superfamily hydrolase (TIGR01509 family)